MKHLLIAVSLSFIIFSTQAQITCHIFPNNQINDTVLLCAGQPLNLVVAGSVLFDDFNIGSLSALWSSNCSPEFTNPCLPSPDGSIYLWVGSASSYPRDLTTISINVNANYQVCFDMVYACRFPQRN